MLHFAHYSLDLVGHSLVDQAGQEVSLTRGEFKLLQEFVQRPGRVCPGISFCRCRPDAMRSRTTVVSIC